MRRLLVAIAIVSLGRVVVAALAPDDPGPWYIDLSAHTNVKLAENFHSGREGNNLANLPTGKQTFAEVKFKIGEGLIQLGEG